MMNKVKGQQRANLETFELQQHSIFTEILKIFENYWF